MCAKKSSKTKPDAPNPSRVAAAVRALALVECWVAKNPKPRVGPDGENVGWALTVFKPDAIQFGILGDAIQGLVELGYSQQEAAAAIETHRSAGRLVINFGPDNMPSQAAMLRPTPSWLEWLSAQKRPRAKQSQPLTDRQREVFDYIKANPGKSGKEIVNSLGFDSESVLTAFFVPALKPHGLRNRRGYGYYIDD